MLPRNRRSALASTCQYTKPFPGFERNGLYDHRSEPKSRYDGRAVARSVESVDVVTGSVRKTIVVVMTKAVDIDGGSRGSCVRIRWDERAELGSLIMWVKFIVNLFPDELYR